MASCTSFAAITPLFSTSLTKSKPHPPIFNFSNTNSLKPSSITFANIKYPLKSSRLRVSYRREVKSKYVFRVSVVLGLGDGDSEAHSELEISPSDAATIDLKLPRRRLQVQFSCDACGETTQRLINRLAYERGTVFVQCSGCLQHHKLIDNLGLVVEYDLREEVSVDANIEEV